MPSTVPQNNFAFSSSPFTSTCAPSPVWRGSTTKPIRFQGMTKRAAVRLFHEARRFERSTRAPGRQDGAIGRNGLAVLHALLFDFLNYATGRLMPAQDTIARAACISARSVRRGLAALKAAGVVNWLRRCVRDVVDGTFRQESNAYAVLPSTQWHGFTPAPVAPAPDSGTWGDHPALPDALTLATATAAAGGSLAAVLGHLNGDEHDGLAKALARLGSHLLRPSSH